MIGAMRGNHCPEESPDDAMEFRIRQEKERQAQEARQQAIDTQNQLQHEARQHNQAHDAKQQDAQAQDAQQTNQKPPHLVQADGENSVGLGQLRGGESSRRNIKLDGMAIKRRWNMSAAERRRCVQRAMRVIDSPTAGDMAAMRAVGNLVAMDRADNARLFAPHQAAASQVQVNIHVASREAAFFGDVQAAIDRGLEHQLKQVTDQSEPPK